MSVLRVPLATVTLTTGSSDKPQVDTFECGKDLISVEVQNGEGDRANTCTVTIADPDLVIAAKYRERSLKAGAIVVPANLLEKPDDKAGESSSGGAGALTVAEGLKGDALARALIKYCRANGVTKAEHIAAVLGTAAIETSMGEFLEEIDDGSNYAYLGADAPWHGRGLIQVTGKANYEKVSKYLGFDFIASPAALKQLRFAIPALVIGMRDGWYTGKRLQNYD